MIKIEKTPQRLISVQMVFGYLVAEPETFEYEIVLVLLLVLVPVKIGDDPKTHVSGQPLSRDSSRHICCAGQCRSTGEPHPERGRTHARPRSAVFEI